VWVGIYSFLTVLQHKRRHSRVIMTEPNKWWGWKNVRTRRKVVRSCRFSSRPVRHFPVTGVFRRPAGSGSAMGWQTRAVGRTTSNKITAVPRPWQCTHTTGLAAASARLPAAEWLTSVAIDLTADWSCLIDMSTTLSHQTSSHTAFNLLYVSTHRHTDCQRDDGMLTYWTAAIPSVLLQKTCYFT